MIRSSMAIALFVAAAARADTLADLKAAVAGLQGATPIHAAVDIERSRSSSGRFVNRSESGRIHLDIEEDAASFRIVFPQDVIARAAHESHEHESHPTRPTPTRMALDETQPNELSDLVDFAGPFLDMLAMGERVSERRVLRDGRFVRLLTLKLTPKLPPEATSVWHVRFSEDTLDVWIGDNNLPIAAKRVRRGSAGFLFLRGEMNRSDAWAFAHAGDRLVVTHLESSFAAAGFGQKGEGLNVVTLTVR